VTIDLVRVFDDSVRERDLDRHSALTGGGPDYRETFGRRTLSWRRQ
jgi:hypothetical protein